MAPEIHRRLAASFHADNPARGRISVRHHGKHNTFIHWQLCHGRSARRATQQKLSNASRRRGICVIGQNSPTNDARPLATRGGKRFWLGNESLASAYCSYSYDISSGVLAISYLALSCLRPCPCLITTLWHNAALELNWNHHPHLVDIHFRCPYQLGASSPFFMRVRSASFSYSSAVCELPTCLTKASTDRQIQSASRNRLHRTHKKRPSSM